ncbi:MAG: FKBP-type peptidyl-prolyl cis-trans isomerase [Gemmatimonadota bacterium]
MRRIQRFMLFATTIAVASCSGESPRAEAENAGSAEREPAEAAQRASQGANQPGEAALAPTDPRDIAFAPALGVDLDAMQRRDSGLYVQVLRQGTGAPAVVGDTMAMHYTVWLPDGRKLDSSFDHTPPEPLPMVLGRTRLIEGWTEGVTGMRLGEKRRLVVPYDLAYGPAGRPPQIPPYSTLVFEVELARHAPGGGP